MKKKNSQRFFLCMILIIASISSVTGIIIENEPLKIHVTNYNAQNQQFHNNGILSNNNWLEQAKLLASDGTDGDLFGQSVSIDGDYALVGTPNTDDNGIDSGAAYIFFHSGTLWTEQYKLLPSDGTDGDLFGQSVSIDGDYAIIGAYLDDDNGAGSGAAYIFTRTGTLWTEQAKLLASDADTGDWFGWSVSISGDYAIVAARHDDTINSINSGSAYIFTRSGTVWIEQAKLLASDGMNGDSFGQSVSVDSDYAIIGAHLDDDLGLASGSAYIFTRSGTVWIEQAKLLASDGAFGERFGWSVKISGDHALIGAPYDDDNGRLAGSAYIFTRSGTVWIEQAKLLASDGAEYDEFGQSVSIDNKYAIIGAYLDGDLGMASGSAYIFTRSGTVWTEQVKLLPSDGTDGDLFGQSVSINGNYALLGAPYDNEHGGDAGSAYIFTKSASPDLECSGSLSWHQVPAGSTQTGAFIVKNIGEPLSLLDWEIVDWPDWGSWTFTPDSGTDLTPETGSITISVAVVAPDQQEKQFSGNITIVNGENSSDYDSIPVSLSTPVITQIIHHPLIVQVIHFLIERFPMIVQVFNLIIS